MKSKPLRSDQISRRLLTHQVSNGGHHVSYAVTGRGRHAAATYVGQTHLPCKRRPSAHALIQRPGRKPYARKPVSASPGYAISSSRRPAHAASSIGFKYQALVYAPFRAPGLSANLIMPVRERTKASDKSSTPCDHARPTALLHGARGSLSTTRGRPRIPMQFGPPDETGPRCAGWATALRASRMVACSADDSRQHGGDAICRARRRRRSGSAPGATVRGLPASSDAHVADANAFM